MEDLIFNLGDIVVSTKGRDSGKHFLIVGLDGDRAYIADGKERKLTAKKKKNVKHLKSVKVAVLKDIAIKIKQGQPVGNDRLFKAIKFQIEKKQED